MKTTRPTTTRAIRKWRIIVGCAAVFGLLASPSAAGAQEDNRTPSRADVRPIEPKPAFENLRLECQGRSSDNGRSAVACKWSPTQRADAAGYVLVRTDGDIRTEVFATRNLRETSAIDTDIRLGVRYAYSILVKNAAGRTIGSGGPVTAGVEKPADIEVLQLSCTQLRPGVAATACEWRSATSTTAVGYQLWRILDRDGRELVWRGGLDETTNVSRVPEDTLVARYAVLAVDRNGDVVGQSRVETVRFRGSVSTIRHNGSQRVL